MIFLDCQEKNCNSAELLQHAGTISAELAKKKANLEYDEFKKRISNQLSPVEIDFIENFEKEQKKLRGK